MSNPGESENSYSVKVEEKNDRSIEEEPSIVIAVDHGGKSQTKTLKEALDIIRETIISSSSSPKTKSTTIAIKHFLKDKIIIPNRGQIIQTPSDNEERVPYPSPVNDWLEKEGYGVSSGSIREISDSRSGSTREIPDSRSGSSREISDSRSGSSREISDSRSGSSRAIPDDRSDSIRNIPVDGPKSGRKVPAIRSPEERSDSDRKKTVRPCDKPCESGPVREEPEFVPPIRTSPEYEWDVDMQSVGTGPDPDELDEVEDMQID